MFKDFYIIIFIWNSGFWFAAVPSTRIQFFDHFNSRLISQLIEGVLSVLERLLRYFKGTIISTSFVPPFPVYPVICCLNSSEALLLLSARKSIILLLLSRAGSSL